MRIFLFVAFALLTVAVFAEKVRYDNFQVHRLTPKDENQLSALRSLEVLNPGYSFWSDVSGLDKHVDIMVPPHLIAEFRDIVLSQNIPSEVYIKNVQDNIDNEMSKSKSGISRAFDWSDYHTLEEINLWLKELADSFPDKVTLVEGGKTYEGRSIMGVHVSFDPSNENNAVFLEGGIHAREWISPATVTYILNELLTSTDPDVRNMALAHDWYIFPNFNPDGFVYTHTTNRLWRKTRKPYGICRGSDPNRNWAAHWMEGGASNNPCAETYAGSAAFSDIETKSMSEYINSIGNKLTAYIAFHSYSQLLLIPYGHSSEHVENYNELYEIGLKAADDLEKRYGTDYTVGNIAEVIYIASGGSMDWVKGAHGTRITYTYELRDKGRYGFVLPADQIIPTGEETLDSLVTILKEFAKK